LGKNRKIEGQEGLKPQLVGVDNLRYWLYILFKHFITSFVTKAARNSFEIGLFVVLPNFGL